jgi:hypothetical protein
VCWRRLVPRFIEHILFVVTPSDPLTFVLIVILLGLVALRAYDAMRVDPISRATVSVNRCALL